MYEVYKLFCMSLGITLSPEGLARAISGDDSRDLCCSEREFVGRAGPLGKRSKKRRETKNGCCFTHIFV